MNPGSKYLYDGKEFSMLEDLPPEARLLYEKNNVNGLLDIYSSSLQNSTNQSKFEIEGTSYNSLNDLPPGLKDKILDKLSSLEKHGLRLIADNNARDKKTNNSVNPDTGFSEVPIAEVSAGFRYKVIIGLLLIAAAIFFIYIFIANFL